MKNVETDLDSGLAPADSHDGVVLGVPQAPGGGGDIAVFQDAHSVQHPRGHPLLIGVEPLVDQLHHLLGVDDDVGLLLMGDEDGTIIFTDEDGNPLDPVLPSPDGMGNPGGLSGPFLPSNAFAARIAISFGVITRSSLYFDF